MTGATWPVGYRHHARSEQGKPGQSRSRPRSPRLALCPAPTRRGGQQRWGNLQRPRCSLLPPPGVEQPGGRLLSGGALTLRIAQALDNSLEGIVSGAGGLDIQAFVLDNRSGLHRQQGRHRYRCDPPGKRRWHADRRNAA
ncbi:hypothetical protein P4048_00055 [Pseudomonas aeruginosa]|nr:hypothetical protein [Pseudomonas aeruginosa]